MCKVLSSLCIHPSPGKRVKTLVEASSELMRGSRWEMKSGLGPVTCRAELPSLPSASSSPFRGPCPAAQGAHGSALPAGCVPLEPRCCAACGVCWAGRNTPAALIEGLQQAFVTSAVWRERKSCQAPLWWDQCWKPGSPLEGPGAALWLTPTERCPPLCCSRL